MESNFRAFRERIGIKTQSELAKKLGIDTANISNWENGKAYPSFLVTKQLLEMGASVEELFGIAYKGVATPEVASEGVLDRIAALEAKLAMIEGAKMECG